MSLASKIDPPIDLRNNYFGRKTVYSTKHSSFAWFDSRIRDYLAYDGVKLTREEGERDVLRVQVGFESLEVETIEQVPIYVDVSTMNFTIMIVLKFIFYFAVQSSIG